MELIQVCFFFDKIDPGMFVCPKSVALLIEMNVPNGKYIRCNTRPQMVLWKAE